MTHLPKYALALSMATLVLISWLGGGQARGQSTGTGTGTPTTATPPMPTTTVTATIPSGQDLLTEAQNAIVARNTYHETARLNQTASSPARTTQTVESSQGDVSLTPQMARVVATTRTTRLNTTPAKTTTQRQQTVILGQTVAIKTGKKAWSCTTVDQLSQTQNLGSNKVQSVDTLGVETVATVPVWHVRAMATVTALGTTVPYTVDYYISQADFTLVRVTSSISATISGVTTRAKIVQDFSKYSEPVKVTLPAACKGKSRAISTRALRPGWAHGAQPLRIVSYRLLVLAASRS